MQRVGIIGLGGMGRGRLRYYAQMADARVEAVADVRAADLRRDDSLSALFEVPPDQVAWYEDAGEMARSGRVDVVDICLPTDLHAEAAVAALSAGVSVLCEKPMALTPVECDAMLAAGDASGRIVMIAQCIRFWPAYTYLMDLVRNGQAGRLLSLQMWREGPVPLGGRGWMGQIARSGGALLDLHIHDVDFIHALLGLPQRVYAQGGQSLGASLGCDYVCSNFDYGHDLLVSATAHWTPMAIPFVARFEARLEGAFLRYDTSDGTDLVVYRTGAQEPERPTLAGPNAYYNEIRYFLDCVRDGCAPSRCPAREARNSVALVQAAEASMNSGEAVAVDGFVI
ncbi:MAG: Gfo/Idh/MocA family protein [Anaerolineae bacterium]